MNTLNDHDDDDDDNENKSPSSYYSDDDDADRDTNDDDDCRSLATTTPSLLAQPETRAVRRGKWGVAAVLILAATGIATAVYTIVARSEATAFETHYADDSAKLLQTLGNRLDESLSVLDSLAVGLHTVAAATNQSWPTVTHPQFALSMAKVLPLTHAVVVSFLPLVKNAQRPEWQDYAERHHDEWIEQGKKVQYEWNGYYGPVLDIVNDENDDTTNNNTTTASFLWNNSILHSDFANLNDTVT